MGGLGALVFGPVGMDGTLEVERWMESRGSEELGVNGLEGEGSRC